MNSNEKVFQGYYLNPCPISVESKGYCNYVGANDTCFRSCYRNAIPLGHSDDVRRTCLINCSRCGDSLLALNGKATSEIRLVPPPGWVEPNFFRQGFVKYQNVEQAYTECAKMCNLTRYPGQCKENCYIDAMSIYKK
jgi:hypothetical protein